MDDLTLFNTDHRIILSRNKSVRVLFERQKSRKLKPQDVTYNGQLILSSSSVKFLGITFDSALTFKSHFRVVAILAPLSATCVASPNVQRIWERIHTHFISRALSIPSFIHDDRKRQHAYLPPIHDRNLYLAKRW